jgi:hypothetical protein
MQFKPELAQKILKGEKTQTRRTVKPGERLVNLKEGGKFVIWRKDTGLASLVHKRIKWQTGQSYSIQPGRGKPGLGRFLLLDIRRELVRDISEEDAIAEGFNSISKFLEAFESINGKAALDKEVWVLTFEIEERKG